MYIDLDTMTATEIKSSVKNTWDLSTLPSDKLDELVDNMDSIKEYHKVQDFLSKEDNLELQKSTSSKIQFLFGLVDCLVKEYAEFIDTPVEEDFCF